MVPSAAISFGEVLDRLCIVTMVRSASTGALAPCAATLLSAFGDGSGAA